MIRRLAAAAHRVALWSCPASFRFRLGDDLHETYVQRVDAARRPTVAAIA